MYIHLMVLQCGLWPNWIDFAKVLKFTVLVVVAIVCIICVYSVYSCRGFWPTMPTVVYPFVVVWVKCRGENPSLIRVRLCL